MKNLLWFAEPQNYRCCYCGHEMTKAEDTPDTRLPRNAITRDHVIPKSVGGNNGENLVAACLQCNNLREDMDAYAFYNLLQKLFARSPALQTNWHTVSEKTLKNLRVRCLLTHERYLRGVAKKDLETAFLHLRLMHERGHILRATNS